MEAKARSDMARSGTKLERGRFVLQERELPVDCCQWCMRWESPELRLAELTSATAAFPLVPSVVPPAQASMCTCYGSARSEKNLRTQWWAVRDVTSVFVDGGRSHVLLSALTGQSCCGFGRKLATCTGRHVQPSAWPALASRCSKTDKQRRRVHDFPVAVRFADELFCQCTAVTGKGRSQRDS